MAQTGREMLEKAERLRKLLETQATGGFADEAEYESLRQELLSNAATKNKLPEWVRRCRDLASFWDFIKPKFAHYHERRNYLREEFEPLLTLLEEAITHTPSDDAIIHKFAGSTSDHVWEAWQKALARRDNDADGAITAARTLLETICKHILDEEGIPYDGNEDIPKLYRMVAQHLKLSPSQHEEQVFKQILGGCQSVVEGLGSLRNRLGDAHGKGKTHMRPAPRHAQLAVNLAGTMGMFLVATWEAQRDAS